MDDFHLDSSPISNPLIIFQNNDFIIADKPHCIPTVPLKGQCLDGTLLGMVAKICPDVLSVTGKNPWEHGALHRLDTATAGLVIFAKTQTAYNKLLALQKRDRIAKTYLATTTTDTRLQGMTIPATPTFTISTYFRSFGPGAREVRPTLDIKKADTPRLYQTHIQILSPQTFRCTITSGFRHQIRAHLAWIGHPILGDTLYGPLPSKTETLELVCVGLTIELDDGQTLQFCREQV